jgi:peptidoglycan/xylan/chitin deacetylase (PgdA/CDA1 family)
MVEPIYKVWMAKATPAYYKLSPEERNGLLEKSAELLKKVGGETVVSCYSAWSSENYQFFGVEKFPDYEAVRKHARLQYETDWWKYVEGTSYLGTEAP